MANCKCVLHGRISCGSVQRERKYIVVVSVALSLILLFFAGIQAMERQSVAVFQGLVVTRKSKNDVEKKFFVLCGKLLVDTAKVEVCGIERFAHMRRGDVWINDKRQTPCRFNDRRCRKCPRVFRFLCTHFNHGQMHGLDPLLR